MRDIRPPYTICIGLPLRLVLRPTTRLWPTTRLDLYARVHHFERPVC